ncbi:MAG: hypothetical protein O7C75_18040 [Verrucomicrobia bacterium]|nr:hypothetical protein [Verrucomicrobiota bacterium]
MRYLIQFADHTHKKVSEEDGKRAIAALAQGDPAVIIRGAYFERYFVKAIKPISKDWVDNATAETEKPESIKSIGEIMADRKLLQ